MIFMFVTVFTFVTVFQLLITFEFEKKKKNLNNLIQLQLIQTL